MKELLPINKDILKWSRESLGLSIVEVATKMKKPVSIIEEWETGYSTPSYPQLEKLAYNVLKRPIALFFFPEIPKEETPKTVFRTLPETIIDGLPSELIVLYRKAKIFQLNLEELYEGLKPLKENLIDKFPLNDLDDIPYLAASIRDIFKITLEEQFSWRSVDKAFKEWRNVMEENGIFIFKDAFHNDDYSGFCVYDVNYPIIFINNSMAISRQIFTIFHELGHLLLNTGGIDFRDKTITRTFNNKYSAYEVKCNQFANEFLVPTKYFQNESLIVSEEQFSRLAIKYSVSREVILRNYLDRNLIEEEYYRVLSDKWIKEAMKKKEESKSGHYYYTQKAYLGEHYINLAFSKYYQNKISIENLSELLNIGVKNISTFEHYAFS